MIQVIDGNLSLQNRYSEPVAIVVDAFWFGRIFGIILRIFMLLLTFMGLTGILVLFVKYLWRLQKHHKNKKL